MGGRARRVPPVRPQVPVNHGIEVKSSARWTIFSSQGGVDPHVIAVTPPGDVHLDT